MKPFSLAPQNESFLVQMSPEWSIESFFSPIVNYNDNNDNNDNDNKNIERNAAHTIVSDLFYHDMQISWPDSGYPPIRLSDS